MSPREIAARRQDLSDAARALHDAEAGAARREREACARVVEGFAWLVGQEYARQIAAQVRDRR